MKRILLMSLLAISTALSAQKPVELELWPDGAPNSNGITTPEQKLENNRISNVSEPTLTIYPAAKPNGLAVVACPGGGYIRLAESISSLTSAAKVSPLPVSPGSNKRCTSA